MYLRKYIYMENVIVWLEHAQCLRGRGQERLVDATSDLRSETTCRGWRYELPSNVSEIDASE